MAAAHLGLQGRWSTVKRQQSRDSRNVPDLAKGSDRGEDRIGVRVTRVALLEQCDEGRHGTFILNLP